MNQTRVQEVPKTREKTAHKMMTMTMAGHHFFKSFLNSAKGDGSDGLDIETEQHDIAVLHDIFFSFGTDQSFFFGGT